MIDIKIKAEGLEAKHGRDEKTSILLIAFWNFKLKVLKYQWNIRLSATVISILVISIVHIKSRALILRVTSSKKLLCELMFWICKRNNSSLIDQCAGHVTRFLIKLRLYCGAVWDCAKTWLYLLLTASLWEFLLILTFQRPRMGNFWPLCLTDHRVLQCSA